MLKNIRRQYIFRGLKISTSTDVFMTFNTMFNDKYVFIKKYINIYRAQERGVAGGIISPQIFSAVKR